MKHYEYDLPEDYKEIYSIDAKDAQTGILLNVAALVIMAAVTVPSIALILINSNFVLGINELRVFIPAMFILCVLLIVYMVLHELTHGAAYYLLTRQKLKFGLTLAVAFCGVPNIFVYKKASLIALLAPFILFNIVFILGMILLPAVIWKLVAAVLFGMHFGGCAGDLYDAILILFKFKGNILVKDTGPKQTFYSNVKQ